MDRRSFLRATSVATGLLTFGPAYWRAALASPAEPGPSPYGPLQPPDANGLMLPEGFTSREIARGGQPVGTTGYVWHTFPDGGATYATPDGGWIYANNSEVPTPGGGGVGAVVFDADGEIVDAYRLLSGTRNNCAGGPTPWGTWLSCEEFDDVDSGGSAGQVFECDPMTPDSGEVRPALGSFQHEAAAVDPIGKRLYLTEDQPDGRFYRFTPDRYPDLSSGLLEVAIVAGNGVTTWREVPDPHASEGIPTRRQVRGATVFDRGEGIWYDAADGERFVYFTTTGDDRVWFHDIVRGRIAVLYDAGDYDDAPLRGVDNVFVSSAGDLYVAEDVDDLQINIITADTRHVAPIMGLTGTEHHGAGGDASSEITGPALNPAGDRMYFNSQRGYVQGVTYEISGPFRTERVGIAARTEGGPPARPAQPQQEGPGGGAQDGGDLPATGGVGLAAGLAALGAAGAIRLRQRRGS